MTWDWQNSNVTDYGGSAEKQDHREGRYPHAYGIYQFLQDAQGSAYSKELTGLLHAENLAEARLGAAAIRAAEKLENNSFPSRADESLQYWVNTTGVSVGPQDSDDDVRRKCQARYQSTNGNDAANVETTVRTLLGQAFVSVERNGGTPLDEPSQHTYWPGVNPGPAIYDLDGTGLGAWLSDNAHICIQYTKQFTVSQQQLDRVIAIDLVELLDTMLPAWATFESTTDAEFAAGTGLAGVSTVKDE